MARMDTAGGYAESIFKRRESEISSLDRGQITGWLYGNNQSTTSFMNSIANELANLRDNKVIDEYTDKIENTPLEDIESIEIPDYIENKEGLEIKLNERKAELKRNEIISSAPEDLDEIEIPEGIINESQLKSQLERRRTSELNQALKNQDEELAKDIKGEELSDYEKATAILGFRPAPSTVVLMRESGEL